MSQQCKLLVKIILIVKHNKSLTFLRILCILLCTVINSHSVCEVYIFSEIFLFLYLFKMTNVT